ncbi:MAG: hypothetical protein AAFN74_08950, partial [Myxococcota bacterium]
MVRSPSAPKRTAGGDDTAALNSMVFDETKVCEKDSAVGISVCKGNRRKVFNIVIGAVITAALLAGLAVIAVLRAMRYRKDLTRLTAQFQQIRK